MKTHTPLQWHDREERTSRPHGTGDGADGNLETIRAGAQDLLAAADDAIERALSANSEEYLWANRQSGGQ